MLAAMFTTDRVRMMQAATQHRVSGEREERQMLDQASNHRNTLSGRNTGWSYIVPKFYIRVNRSST